LIYDSKLKNLKVAEEAMGDKGLFKVSCKSIDIDEQGYISLNQGKYIKISFEDHGCGIPKHCRKKIHYSKYSEVGLFKLALILFSWV